MTQSEALRNRAMAYITAKNGCNACIVSETAADAQLVLLKGSGNTEEYRKFRIEYEWMSEEKERLLQLANRQDLPEMKQFIEGKHTIEITCSKTDIIEIHFPYIDLD